MLGLGTLRTSGRAFACLSETLEPRRLLSADLSGTFSGTTPSELLPAGRNRLVLRLNNEGDAPTAGETVGITLFASSDDTIDESDFSLATVSKRLKLNAARSVNVNFTFQLPDDVPDGKYFLLARIDDTSAVVENSEGNNIATTSSMVEIRQPFVDLSGTVDVVAAAGTIAIVQGKKAKPPKVSLVVSNAGNVSAAGTLAASVFASSDTRIGDSDDVPLGTTTRRVNIRPGKPLKVKPKITIPADLPTGDWNVVATLDFSGNVPESTPADNRAASTTTFTIDNPAFPTRPPEPQIGALLVDTAVVAVNVAEQPIFEVSVTDAPAGIGVTLNEVDAAGNLIAKIADLFDNGAFANGDITAGDGVFSGIASLQFAAAGDRFFQAELVGEALSTASVKITVVPAPTQQQLAFSVSDAISRQTQLNAFIAAGQTRPQAIQSLAQALATDPDVQPESILTGVNALTYVDATGIQVYVKARSPGVLSASSTAAQLSPADESDGSADCGCGGAVQTQASVIAPLDVAAASSCGQAAILSPTPLGASGNFSETIRQTLLNPPADAPSAPTFTVAPTLSEADAGVDAFKNLSQFKFVALTAESFAVPGALGIKLAEQATGTSNLARVGDLVTNRIAIDAFDQGYVLTPRFFLHYNGDMDGAVVFANLDSAGADSSLADSFLRRGAGAFYGFSGERATASFVQQRPKATLEALLRGQTASEARVAPEPVFNTPVMDPGNAATEWTLLGADDAELNAGCAIVP